MLFGFKMEVKMMQNWLKMCFRILCVFLMFFYGFSVAKTCPEIMKMSVSCRRDAHFHKIAFFDFDSHFD